MTTNYFGFSGSPFENNLDQRFLFLSENHKEVLAALLYFVRERKGFALVCGDVGTGKTMLINCFLEKLPKSFQPIIISNPDVEYVQILGYIAGQLGIAGTGKGPLELIDDVKNALIEAKHEGRHFVLIIDEAHLLSDRSLEHVRLFSNIETQDQKLLQILLVGQYELSHKLDRVEMRQLRQRININRFLAPMDPSETIRYIEHRLNVVGSRFDACFEPSCKNLIFKMTEGVPRRINQLCDSALLICEAERARRVTRKVLQKANNALQSDLIFTPTVPRHALIPMHWRNARAVLLIGPYVMFFGILGILGYGGYLGKTAQHIFHHEDSASLTSSQKAPVPLPPSNDGGRREMLPAAAPGRADPGPEGLSSDSVRTLPSQATGLGKKLQQSHSPAAQGVDGNLPSPGSVESKSPLEKTLSQRAPQKSNEDLESTNSISPKLTGKETGRTADTLSSSPLSERQAESALPSLNNVSVDGVPPVSDKQIKDKTTEDTGSKASNTIVVKKGETLMMIASRWFPEDPESGVREILKVNPNLSRMDRVYPGQLLIIPAKNTEKRSSELTDIINSMPSLLKD